jgi:hypothetical protein
LDLSGTPATLEQYKAYWPKAALPDVVGMGWEPSHSTTLDDFIKHMKPFHDAFSSSTVPFILSEMQPGTPQSTVEDRINFLEQITCKKAADELPNYIGAIYINSARKRVLILDNEGVDKYTRNRVNKAVSDAFRCLDARY